MGKTSIALAMLVLIAANAQAQPASAPVVSATQGEYVPARWDLSFSAGVFEARPEGTDSQQYGDDWYLEGRYAVGVGHYWTEHFKTEFEFAHTGEGHRYVQDVARTPANTTYPISIQKFHRLQQYSGRAVWQFLENNWVHPYVNGGVVFDAERQHTISPQQLQWPADPRTGLPVVVRPEVVSESTTKYRAGVTFGTGAKFYVSPNGYLSAGMQVTYSNPAATVTFLGGFGIDF